MLGRRGQPQLIAKIEKTTVQQTNTTIFGRSLSSSHQHCGVQTAGLCQFEQASLAKLCPNLFEHELWDSFGSITDRKFKSSGVESRPLQEKALFQQLGIVLLELPWNGVSFAAAL